MLDYVGPAVLAFVIASFVTWLERVTSKYPQTVPFLLGNWQIYVYSLIYGGIAFGVTLAFPALLAAGVLQLEGVAKNPWLQGVAIGLAVKTILHIRLFTVQSVPVGLETIVLIFEPWLLNGVDYAEFTAVRRFIRERAKDYTDLTNIAQSTQKVKATILANLPRSIKKEAFQVDLDKCADVVEAMELYLRQCGVQVFDMTFPKVPPAGPPPR